MQLQVLGGGRHGDGPDQIQREDSTGAMCAVRTWEDFQQGDGPYQDPAAPLAELR